jgi:hypothetical protein
MGFHGRRSAMGNRAEEEHRDSQLDGISWQEVSDRKTELRRSTGTHTLDGISWQEVSDRKKS